MRRDACYMKQAHIDQRMRRLHVRSRLVLVHHPCHALHIARAVQGIPMDVRIIGFLRMCSGGSAPMHAMLT